MARDSAAVAVGDAAGHRRQLVGGLVVAEHVVALQGDLAEVADALLVVLAGVDGVAAVLRQRQL